MLFRSAGTVTGNGVIQGLGSLSGTIAPGANGIGKLTFNNSITFGSNATVLMEAKKLPNATDVISSAGTMTFNGTASSNNTAYVVSGTWSMSMKSDNQSGSLSGSWKARKAFPAKVGNAVPVP